jgi:uncharacterized membrane protein YphA (DoxX/SURF4 family)/peroxiredoxin
MELTLLAVRLVLAAVFLLAGVAKLADHKGSSKALTEFGLPPRMAQPLSLLLSMGEFVIGVTLVPVALTWYAACGALALLGIFMIGIVTNLARGRKPDCHCFGQLHSAPVGWPTVVRTGVLGAGAGWLVSRGPSHLGPSLWEHLASADGNERRVFIFAACVVGILLIQALRGSAPEEPESVTVESHESPSRYESPPTSGNDRTPPLPESAMWQEPVPLPIGTPAPKFALPTMAGQERSLQSLLAQGKTIFLVFSSPHCDPCRTLLPHIRGWMSQHEESLNIIVISRGTANDNLAKMKDFEVSRVLLQQGFEISNVYGCSMTPSAVLVGTDGLIRSDVAVGKAAIEQLISSTQSLQG